MTTISQIQHLLDLTKDKPLGQAKLGMVLEILVAHFVLPDPEAILKMDTELLYDLISIVADMHPSFGSLTTKKRARPPMSLETSAALRRYVTKFKRILGGNF